MTGLRAYELNKISVDNGDLPISAQVHSDVLQVVPSYKGVAAATFDISRDLSATMQIRLPDGSPLPAGIDVVGEGRPSPLITGYGGTLQLDSPRAGERFEANWRTGHCSLHGRPHSDHRHAATNRALHMRNDASNYSALDLAAGLIGALAATSAHATCTSTGLGRRPARPPSARRP